MTLGEVAEPGLRGDLSKGKSYGASEKLREEPTRIRVNTTGKTYDDIIVELKANASTVFYEMGSTNKKNLGVDLPIIVDHYGAVGPDEVVVTVGHTLPGNNFDGARVIRNEQEWEKYLKETQLEFMMAAKLETLRPKIDSSNFKE